MPRSSHSSVLAVAALALAVFPALAHAQAWQCRGGRGQVAYQDRPCAAGAAARSIEFAPAPAPQASPEYRLSSRSPDRASRSTLPAPPARTAHSFECRASNGEVFYRHGACPASIAIPRTSGARREAATARVSAQPLSRREACRRMQATARAGRERDESYSTYERNLGRDPCR